MKKILLITNLLTLFILSFIVIKRWHFIPETQQQPQPCAYQLKYFDFHYRKEVDSPSVIMLGNSLIRHAKWDSLLDRKDIINRGISGDNLRCMCERLSYLKNSSAKIVFIEGGINDIPGSNLDSLYNYFHQIVNFWLTENKIPVIDLVIYISPKAGDKFSFRTDYKAINTSVKYLNNRLRAFAINNKIDFIDMNTVLSNEKELQLKNEYTTDGVHLTADAYELWAAQVKEILNKYKI